MLSPTESKQKPESNAKTKNTDPSPFHPRRKSHKHTPRTAGRVFFSYRDQKPRLSESGGEGTGMTAAEVGEKTARVGDKPAMLVGVGIQRTMLQACK